MAQQHDLPSGSALRFDAAAAGTRARPAAGRLPELDGLRGLAALGVVIFHAKMRWFPCGWAAVDLFFVLSGYLITAILLRHGGAPGFLRSFYARRGLRVWPLYFVVLGLVMATARWHREPPNGAGLPYALTFTQGVPLYWNGLAPVVSPMWMHTWTLALEEQFYLLWPVALLLVGRRGVAPLAVACVAGSVAARAAGWNFTLLLARSDGMALGALLALLLVDGVPTGRRRLALRLGLGTSLALGLATVVSLGALTGKPEDTGPAATILGYNALFLGLVGLAVIESGHPWLAVLRQPPVRWLGQVSYGLYLIHHPIYVAVRWVARDHGILGAPRWLYAPTILGCIALAGLSYHLFEAPLLRLKDRFAYPNRDAGGRHAARATSDKVRVG